MTRGPLFRCRNNPVLEITYNTTPNVPDQRSAEVGASAGVPCATGSAAPYITTLTPTLRARVSDADGGRGQTVRGYFEWHVTGGAKIGERITAYVGSGTPVTAPIPADGRRYSWRVMAQDGGVGRMGVFTFRPGDTDIGGYLYALNDDTPGAAPHKQRSTAPLRPQPALAPHLDLGQPDA
ncbi:hypothetical protein [Nonomuraea turcica]|uniref:hypothetical protein n=1 Tax=Nonomuraea sp. G32 TaxID=3067274 RepID=UPI00273B7F33|nr:hypothetical protein [Nonomuraea sp. G32]MDP4502012.1 hypothetical protein [Nonomuraea sp. G32]